MSQNDRASLDRRAAAWLEDGPDVSPAGLLGRTLQQSRKTRQRPGWLALVLGAPTAPSEGYVGSAAIRPLLVALGLLLAGAVAVLAFGSRIDQPVTVIASPVPTLVATPGSTLAASTTSPTTPTPTFSVPLTPDVYRVAGWGITLRRPATTPWRAIVEGYNGDRIGNDLVGDPIRYVFASVEQTALDVYFDPCADAECWNPSVTVSLARGGFGLVVGTTSCWDAPGAFVFDCLGSNDLWPVTVNGDTLESMTDDWLATVGAATVTPMTLDGERAVLLDHDGRRAVLAIHGDIRIALITQLPSESGEVGIRAVDSVIAGLQFDDSTGPSTSSGP